MLNNLVTALNTVLPVFIIIALGYFAKRKNFISDQESKKFNKIAFVFFGPCMMFSNVYGKDLKSVWDGKLVLYCVIAEVALCVLAFIVIMAIEKDNKSRGALIQAIFRSNSVIMGVPIATNLLGGDNIGVVVMVLAIFVPLQNFLSVVTLEIFRGQKLNAKSLLKGVVTNPFIMGSALGMLCVICNITLPQFAVGAVKSLGTAMTPVALFLLGTEFNLKPSKKVLRNTVIGVVARLLMVPLLGITAGALLGFRGVGMVAIVAIFAAPTAVTTFTMAQQMNSDYELAGNLVVYSSFLSMFTLTFAIMITKTLGLF